MHKDHITDYDAFIKNQADPKSHAATPTHPPQANFKDEKKQVDTIVKPLATASAAPAAAHIVAPVPGNGQ